MNKYVKEFCKRGLMWGSWGGPLVLAIVWLCLYKAGTVTTLTVNEAVVGIITTEILGFLAAGISIVNQIESLPKAFAFLIQGVVLYVDYLVFYLINGWISVKSIGLFTLIFATIFIVIWLSIYISIKAKVSRLNSEFNK